MFPRPLEDAHGRRFFYLRLSLTDVCNFRCLYCLPRGYAKTGHVPLSTDEVIALSRAFVSAGVGKIRLTGGEPTVRDDLCDIVDGVARLGPTVALSTNGYRLDALAGPLAAAGLTHLNVSIDSLDRAIFAEITGQDRLPEILAGVDRAIALGLRVKVNVVRLRGLNDGMLAQAMQWVRERPVVVRFIQLMRTGDNGEVFDRHHVPYDDDRAELLQRGFLPRSRAADAGPAEELFRPGDAGGIGFIAPYSSGFCETCNRLRVTSTGQLQMCLFGEGTVDLRSLIGHDDALIARVREVLPAKAPSHLLQLGQVGRTRHLAMVGG